MDEFCGCEFEETTLSQTLGKARLAIVFGVAYHDDEAINWAYDWLKKAETLARGKEDQEKLSELSKTNLLLEPVKVLSALKALEDKERKTIRDAFAHCIKDCLKMGGKE